MEGSGLEPVILGAVTVRLAHPSLSIRRTRDAEVTLTWPLGAPSYVLEKTDRLRHPIPWEPVPGASADSNDYSVTLPMIDSEWFFRLKK